MSNGNSEDNNMVPNQMAPQAPAVEESDRHPNGRYKKTFSGNPAGRPKGKKEERAWSNRQISRDILKEANREVIVQTNGKAERVTMLILMIRQQLLKAGKGDDKAFKTAYDLITKTQSWRENKDWKFYEILEQCEVTFDEATEIFSKKVATESRNRWRKKSREI